MFVGFLVAYAGDKCSLICEMGSQEDRVALAWYVKVEGMGRCHDAVLVCTADEAVTNPARCDSF